MPKDFFSVKGTTSLHGIKAGGKIHVIGVCGVAMAQLAVELAQRGYAVTGSDKEFYEPMGSLLAASPVKTLTGYAAENVPSDADLVVIGNAISYGNPEVDIVEQKNLPYTCFPQLLEETLISGKHSIVACGTHGKSTTTAMIAGVLRRLETDPSYFVGGIAQDLPDSLHVGSGKFSVVEGDEYDSAFFAKVPKFDFYKPDTCIINAIEYDHADIYPTLESVEKEFIKLVLSVPATGVVYCCVDFESTRRLLPEWRKTAKAKIVTFGLHESADVRIVERTQDGFVQKVTARLADGSSETFSIPVPGIYNAKNALVTLLVMKSCGLDLSRAKEALAQYKPVKRRQEIRADKNGVVLIEDFAHHPTAVNETILGIREAFPGKKLWAVFEPRSNTSRRKVFQEPYVQAFKNADVAVLCNVTARAIDSGVELIDVAQLAEEIKEKNDIPSSCLPDAQGILDHVFPNLSGNDVVLLMSNGAFGGLPKMFEDKILGGN